ncbi:MAG TPA: hypothetical protein H9722_00480 [Candidatus Mediterraneibacter pullistercoris]|nr:hypothetical protein [Candidatus Mediterraneibacter pullistercoris]
MGNNNNSGILKFFGVLMILFGLIYAALGTAALIGELGGILPGHEAQETLVVVLAYAVALIAIVLGIACVKGALGVSRALGLVFAAFGLVSLIYLQVTQDTFSIFDCVALVFGIAIVYVAGKSN